MEKKIAIKEPTVKEKMLRTIDACCADAKGDIGGNLYLNDGSTDWTNELQQAIDLYRSAFSKKKLPTVEVVAVFVPTPIDKRENFLVIGEKGFCWVKNYKDDERTSSFFFVIGWGDFVTAEVLHKGTDTYEDYMNCFWLNDGSRRAVVLGSCARTIPAGKTKKNEKKKETLERGTFFITHLINSLKEIDETDSEEKITGEAAKLIEIVRNVKENTEADLGGDLYLRGNIPQKKLGSAMQYFKEMLRSVTDVEDELLQNEKIRKKDIVALYLSTETAEKQKCFNMLLFTTKGLYFDKNGRYSLAGFIYWKQIKNCKWVPNNKSPERKKIELALTDKVAGQKHVNLFIPARCEEAVAEFFVPVLKKLSAVQAEKVF